MQQAVWSSHDKNRSHWHYTLLLGVGALLTSFIISIANWYFYQGWQQQHLRNLANIRAIQQDNAALQLQNAALKDQISELTAHLMHTDNADSSRLLQETLTQLHEEKFNLEEELHFYQNLAAVNPEEKAQFPVNIKKFTITPQQTEQAYRYRLVLTYLEKKGETQRGTVQFYVLGSLNGRKQRLKMQQSQSNIALNYEFRHFQRLSGILALPEQFIPEQIVVDLKPSQGKAVQQVFTWQRVLITSQ